MDESNKKLTEGEWKSPIEKLWDIFMFRTFILPTLLKILNVLVTLLALYLTAVYLFNRLSGAIPKVWIYVIMLRVASELIMLLYNFLLQRTQIK
jgi:hypothetical protein